MAWRPTGGTLVNLSLWKTSINTVFQVTIHCWFADVPNVEISTEQQIYFGSKTTLTSKVLSCPSPDGVEWQESNSGQTFDSIDITKPKYYGSSCNPKSPLLVMPKVTFIEKLNYRLLVWNKIGEQYSNTVFLDVIGSTYSLFWILTFIYKSGSKLLFFHRVWLLNAFIVIVVHQLFVICLPLC